MEVEAPMLASRQAVTPTPESIRQRQLDRLSPRGRFAKENRIDGSIRDIQDALEGPVKISQGPAVRVARRASPGTSNTRWNQDGMRQERNAASRTVGAGGEVKIDITPDGGSAGREGRHFTVANVGNNGRIYLRYVRPDTPANAAGMPSVNSSNGRMRMYC
jgi:hypothetical protein